MNPIALAFLILLVIDLIAYGAALVMFPKGSHHPEALGCGVIIFFGLAVSVVGLVASLLISWAL